MCSADPWFWRQIIVVASSSLHALSAGIIFAYPSSLNEAILSPNATEIKATTDQASWIASTYGFSGIIGYFIFSPLFQIIGRKPVNILYNFIVMLGWVILYFSKSIAAIFIAKSIQGFAIGGIFLAAVTISELTHHKRRGVFLTFMKTSMACGSLLCHSLATIWNWRQIAAITFVPSIMALVFVLFFPESPAFYAMKGRFKDCEKSYSWFHGDSPESKNKLRELMSAQMEILQSKQKQRDTSVLNNFWKKYFSKEFLMPYLIVTISALAVDASGRYFLLGYVTQIMVELIGDKYIAMYCAMIADCLLIFASCISSLIIKSFKRRTLLLRFGGVSVLLMFAVSISTIFKSTTSVTVKWATPFIILLHSFVSHIGFIPACFTIATEIFPVNLRGQGSLGNGINFSLFYALSMKITPLIIDKTGIGGTYFIYGLCVALCLIVLYFIVPETKDKTLQEIEDGMRNVKRTDTDIELILSNIPKE